MPNGNTRTSTLVGRPPATSHQELERAAFDLFLRKGFDQTSVDDIAAAVGIGRRTFFRYYHSKLDVVWGDFEGGLSRMRSGLNATPADVPVMRALRAAVIDFNTVPDDQLDWHRRRMTLILGEPPLLANSTLRFAAWRAVLADFVALRLGTDAQDLLPTIVGYSALGGSLTAYEHWLAHPGSDLRVLFDQAWDALESGLVAPFPVPGPRARR